VELSVDIMIMSGVHDGKLLNLSTTSSDGVIDEDGWMICLGRRDTNDVCLRDDTYSSRLHARLIWRQNSWWLEDCDSKNGTYVDDQDEDKRVDCLTPIKPGQLFRVGRTWLRIHPSEA
jgi:pSer/pThr/pTyr-binding forkhead associated (FHA) protein